MKHITFPFHTAAPKYIQIYEQMKGYIEQGKVVADEQLPSIRELAQWLNVSRNTTLQAYDLLVAEGYIRSSEKKGYFVNAVDPIFITSSEPQLEEIHSSREQMLDFRLGAIDQRHFPIQKWRQISNAVLQDDDTYTYGEPFGERTFRVELTKYLFQARGVSAKPEQIIIGSNTQQLLMHLSFLLKQFSNTIALENPGYRGAREVFKLQNFEVEWLAVNEKGLQLEKISSLHSSMMYITPSHQYPFGTALSIQDRQKLLEWAVSRNGYILEDDYDGEFRYGQKTFPAIASLNQEHVIYLGTFSKAFLPGVRLAYVVLPQSLTGVYKEMFQSFEHNASLLHQLAMAEFMRQGEWNKHIRRMRKVYRRKMELLKQELAYHLGGFCEVIGTNAGLYVLLKIETTISEEELIMKAKQQNVIVYPGDELFVDAYTSARFILLGFANLSEEQIVEGVEALKIAWT